MNIFKTDKIDIYRIRSNGDNESVYEVYRSNIIGKGTYSTIYLGRCIKSKIKDRIERLDKFVAVKKIVLDKNHVRSRQMVEIDIMRELIDFSHLNIIKCYEIISDGDIVYIIMEYCNCGDFSSLLIGRPMSENWTKYYFKQIIDGLKFLHDKNIIHRDIKPKNILLSNNRKTVKICDFGFAKKIDYVYGNNMGSGSLKKIATVCGSPLYMAPEIYQNNGYTESVDIWSLGIILYEMLTGKHPLSSHNSVVSVSSAIIKKNIDIPKVINREFANLLKKMLTNVSVERMCISELVREKWLNINYNDLNELMIYTHTNEYYISDTDSGSDSDTDSGSDSGSDSDTETDNLTPFLF
jgi:serine/threonine protein kinase